MTAPSLLLTGLAVALSFITLAGVQAATSDTGSGSDDDNTTSASTASSSTTTPLGCTVPDTSSASSSDRWLACTERELADRICDTDISDLTPQRSGTYGGTVTSSYVGGYTFVEFEYYPGQYGGGQVTCGSSSYQVSGTDLSNLAFPGDESDLSSSLRWS